MRTRQFFLTCLALVQLAAMYGAAGAAAVRAPNFACDSGPYAVVLPRHYPSLHGIGKHKMTDLESRSVGATTTPARRLEYIGMRLDVLLSSADPTAYRILNLDVNSRRWNIGPLSVGLNPWRTVKDPALEGVAQDGVHELIGPRDTATLVVRSARIEKVSYRCPVPGSS